MSRPSTKPAPQMAFITIGYGHFLMESSKAMKVAELMQHAVNADWNYIRGDSDTYTANGPVNVEFKLVRQSQIRMSGSDQEAAQPAAQKRLTR